MSKKGEKTKECRNCKYYYYSDFPTEYDYPQCRRFPKWEKVHDFHSCGEFKKEK